MQAEHAKKAFIVYQNFVSLTNVMRNKADVIMREFDFNVKMPQYYTPEASLVETLRSCVEAKQKGGSASSQQLEKVSNQLRGGMNRDQF